MLLEDRVRPLKYLQLIKLAAVVSLLSILLASEHEPVARAQSVARGRITDGETLFRLSCASSYCHGEQGKGGGAPALRDGTIEHDRLTQVIVAGVPGTAMPAFGAQLSPAEIERLTAYIISLSESSNGSNGNARTQPGQGPTIATVGEKALEKTDELVAGRELFFGATEIDNCRVCHSFGGKGGQVGPDLTGIGSRSESEIRESIVNPSERVVLGYEKLQVTTRDGQRFIGVKRDENDERLRLFDTTTLPPVSRSIAKGDIVNIEKVAGSAMPGGFATRLTERQLRDLVKFLRSR